MSELYDADILTWSERQVQLLRRVAQTARGGKWAAQSVKNLLARRAA